MFIAIKLIVIGVATFIGGILLLANEQWGIGLAALAFGATSAFGGIRKILVPASVAGTTKTETGSSNSTEASDDSSEIHWSAHRRIIEPHDSRPPLPFKI